MNFSFHYSDGTEAAPPAEVSYLMGLAFVLLDLERDLSLEIDRTHSPAPEVEAAEAAWSGQPGQFGPLTVKTT